jgi:hypothetical protein
MTKQVHEFDERTKDTVDPLGGKGADLSAASR